MDEPPGARREPTAPSLLSALSQANLVGQMQGHPFLWTLMLSGDPARAQGWPASVMPSVEHFQKQFVSWQGFRLLIWGQALGNSMGVKSTDSAMGDLDSSPGPSCVTSNQQSSLGFSI